MASHFRNLWFLKPPAVTMRITLKKYMRFDAVIISSEVRYEKPDGNIFRAALDQLSVEANKAVHVGDDKNADKEEADAVGIDCWLSKSSDIGKRVVNSAGVSRETVYCPNTIWIDRHPHNLTITGIFGEY
ncbi:uncharacterized protein [Primulina huaijiensis]|uniref:uncharacterized protein isoform X1 n=1 Tax=Primulina huaijiensis TaxID=1492673 RepID=UPI003CC6E8CD